MARSAADAMMDLLQEWGVDVIFGLPGDGINGLMEALRKRADEIRFIQVRHEESASFAAAAYAKWTGRLGVCLRPPVLAACTSSTACMTPSSRASPCWPSPATTTTTSSTRTRSRTST